jgi:hypothetical protein
MQVVGRREAGRRPDTLASNARSTLTGLGKLSMRTRWKSRAEATRASRSRTASSRRAPNRCACRIFRSAHHRFDRRARPGCRRGCS